MTNCRMRALRTLLVIVLLLASVPQAAATPDATLLRQAEALKPAIVALGGRLIAMPSGTDDLPQLKAKLAMLEEVLTAMGGTVEYIPAPTPREGTYNMRVTWRGSGTRSLHMQGHIDTVWDVERSNALPFRQEGSKALGAGASDMQMGIAMMAHIADAVANRLGWRAKFSRLTLTFTCDEEKGSAGSKEFLMDTAKTHDAVFIFENGGPGGDTVAISARGAASYRIEVKGEASHSGSSPRRGKNAGYELAHQILQLSDLSDQAKGTDVNWTMGGFGTKSNVIPDTAWAVANVRFSDPKEAERVRNTIRERIKKTHIPGTVVTARFSRGSAPFEKNEQTDALAAAYATIAKEELDLIIRPVALGATGDARLTAKISPTLEGMGPGGGRSHSDNEFANLDSLTPRTYMALRMALEVFEGRAGRR